MKKARYGDKFENGAIVRLALRNFLTHDFVEVTPDPHLNLVLGPNGSGKSAFMCALCLAFAGSLNSLSRQSRVGEFIKWGQDFAEVEVEIHDDSKKRNPVLKCLVKRRNCVSYYLNNKECTVAEVQSFAAEYNIQVDNLCQFLAQDNVVQFSRQSPSGLLRNTTEAVGSAVLKQLWKQANNSYELNVQRKNELERLHKCRDALEEKLVELRPIAERCRKTDERKQEVQQLKWKLSYLAFQEGLKSHECESVAFDQLKKQIRAQCNSEKEIEAKVAEMEQRNMDDESGIQNKKDLLYAKVSELKAQKAELTNINAAVRNAFQSRLTLQSDLERNEESVRQLSDTVQHLQLEMQSKQQSSKELLDKLNSVNEQLRCRQQEANEAESSLENVEFQITSAKAKIETLRAEIKRRGDLENERIQVLSRLDRNCVTAYRLLLNNRSKFKGDAWLPLLSIQIGHSLNAILIENAIPIRDLLTFVFENSNDIEIFLDLTKQSGIKVSCGLAPSNPKLPTLVLDDELKSHGFTNVVSDMFDAPNGLKCYLTKLLGLNRICVGSLKTEQRLSVVVPLMSKRYLMVFFTPNLKISSRKSVYSGKLTTRQVGLQNRGIFQSGTSASVLTHMSKELEDKQSELAQLTIERTNLEQKLGECKNAMAPYKEQQNELKQMLGRITSLADQLRLEKESLKRRQEKLPEMQASLCSAADALGPQLWSKLQLLKTARDSLENAHEIAKDLILSNLARSISLFALDNAKEELLKIKSDLYVKKENVFSLQRAFLTRAEQLVRTKIELLDQLGMDSSNVSVKNLSAPVTLPKELRSLPCDLEELTNKITKLEFALNRCRADDEQALKEYTKCCDELERINANYERLGNEVTVSTSELSKVKKQWINEARKLVKSISNRFSYLMKELGYNGEVVLDTPDDKAPIDHYGFKILVAFGSNEFHELNDQHQSGGERSVSIILYILALQELSVVPFRCVDEINQGMDPVNERKVFELMVRMLNGEVSGSELQRTQYIIFTPKLLPNCDFGERTKIWCIFNGMGALPQNTLSSALKNASENTDDDQTDRHPLA